MSQYIVYFLKHVLGSNGREAEICQSTLPIEALDEGQAIELAKQKFCEKQRLGDWSLHADRIQVRNADLPS